MTLATKPIDSQPLSARIINSNNPTPSPVLNVSAPATANTTTSTSTPVPVVQTDTHIAIANSFREAIVATPNPSSSQPSNHPNTSLNLPFAASQSQIPVSSSVFASRQHQHSPFLSRKRSAALMMDLDKPARPSANPNAPHPDPEDIEMSHAPHQLAQQRLHPNHDDELSTAQRLFDVTLDSPSSPGAAYKRMRSSADSDAGSSSCKDMDDPDVMAPDSVPALLHQIRQLMDYVANKPTLQNGSASFVRDYLRTMLIQNSVAAEEAIQAAAKYHKADVAGGRKKPNQYFRLIPDDLAKHIFSFLDGHNLARAREVCRRWNEFACEEPLWKELCLKKWRSLETDKELWKLIDKNVDANGPNRWREIFPKVNRSLQWNCRLQKTGRFICNLVAHHISGAPLGEAGIPSILVVERRFNILHLQTFVRPDASILYFEPESESDRSGFVDFIEYLNKRTRAGLALEGQLRFIFIPPCDYTRTQVEYQGQSLLGVVQNAYPHVPE